MSGKYTTVSYNLSRDKSRFVFFSVQSADFWECLTFENECLVRDSNMILIWMSHEPADFWECLTFENECLPLPIIVRVHIIMNVFLFCCSPYTCIYFKKSNLDFISCPLLPANNMRIFSNVLLVFFFLFFTCFGVNMELLILVQVQHTATATGGYLCH